MAKILTNKDMKEICRIISTGGSPIEWARKHDIDWNDLGNWMAATPERQEMWQRAEKIQQEWAVITVLQELRNIAMCDPRKMFDDNGRLKHPSEWPDGITIESFDVMELMSGEGEIKKVKLVSKLKAIETLMKHLGILTERLTINGKFSHDVNFIDKFFGIDDKRKVIDDAEFEDSLDYLNN